MAGKRKKPGERELWRIRLLQEALEGRGCGQAEKAAQQLWKTWGSLGNILEAPEEALAASPGMDRESARYLRLTLELARACLEERTDGVRRVADRRTAIDIFLPMFFGRRSEVVGAVLLDSGGRIIYGGIISEGAVSAVPMYSRKLVRMCIDYDAEGVLLAHNHITGSIEPSKQDILTTKQLELALGCIQVRLLDHIILTDRDQFSFTESGLMRTIIGENLEDRRTGLTEALDLVDQLEETGWDYEA